MATAVLRPRDYLTERIGNPPVTSISRRKNPGYYFNPTSTCNYENNHNSFSFPNPNPNPSHRSNRRSAAEHRKPAKRPSSDDIGILRPTPEKVTILRRGESLDSKIKSDAMGIYAGSGFVVSPCPSALPLPSFSVKKQASADLDSVDDSATRDLRRLLRIG